MEARNLAIVKKFVNDLNAGKPQFDVSNVRNIVFDKIVERLTF